MHPRNKPQRKRVNAALGCFRWNGIRRAIGADCDRMAASVVGAIDQQPAHAHLAHFTQTYFSRPFRQSLCFLLRQRPLWSNSSSGIATCPRFSSQRSPRAACLILDLGLTITFQEGAGYAAPKVDGAALCQIVGL